VQAAAIWWWMDRVEQPRELGWLFVGVDGQDIDEELRAELRRRYWMRPRYWRVRSLLLPASIAADDENGYAHDVTTGERGTRLWVAGTRFSSRPPRTPTLASLASVIWAEARRKYFSAATSPGGESTMSVAGSRTDAVSTPQVALMTAISARDLAAVKAAVEGGADPSAAGPHQCTSLHQAAE